MQNDQPQADHFTLVICSLTGTNGKLYGPMIFYNLNLGKVVKVIANGRGFASYKPAIQPAQYGTLTYLSDSKGSS